MNRAALARRCLQLALVLCAIGLVPAFLAIWGQRRAAADAAWHNPADDLRPAAIAPDLALLSLAGVPDDQVLTLAIETGELETTRALLVFSADLADQQRINGWLWLAYRYQQAEQRHHAAQAYRLAGIGAVLSDDLPDLLRTETLLSVGRQLVALHDKPSARFYLSQAALIGANASNLTDYHRRSLLERLIPASLQAGGRRENWIALAKKVKNNTGRGRSETSPWRNVTPGSDAALAEARDERRAAAADWLAMVTGTSSELAPTEAVRHTLRQALWAEDAAIDRYLERALTDDNNLAAQETRLRWLLLKRRIAAGGAGAGLMPEWESSREQIEAALTAAWADWLASGTGGQGWTDQASRRAVVAAYWGLYPEAPVADLLLAARRTTSFGGLRLTIITAGTPPLVGWGAQKD